MTTPNGELVLLDGRSRMVVTREPGGRIRIAVNDLEAPGYAVTFGAASADEIAAFLTSGSTDRPAVPSRLEARLP